ncbi:gallinacin-13-like [Protopterus annectens]|uniref:gallinacin-13-like n=1 Tax=Protopterus annectens TaxID=7888 RepID=UPI001CF9AB96|nr:gallinacin-13-like [Protopterus annectens]
MCAKLLERTINTVVIQGLEKQKSVVSLSPQIKMLKAVVLLFAIVLILHPEPGAFQKYRDTKYCINNGGRCTKYPCKQNEDYKTTCNNYKWRCCTPKQWY